MEGKKGRGRKQVRKKERKEGKEEKKEGDEEEKKWFNICI